MIGGFLRLWYGNFMDIKHNGVEYYQPTKQGYAVSHVIATVWDELGRPETPLSSQGEKLMEVILSTWQDTHPDQYKEWAKIREEHLSAEMSIQEQVKKKTGRTLASYPEFVFHIMRRVFPQFSFSDRENVLKLVKKYPIFRFVEKV